MNRWRRAPGRRSEREVEWELDELLPPAGAEVAVGGASRRRRRGALPLAVLVAVVGGFTMLDRTGGTGDARPPQPSPPPIGVPPRPLLATSTGGTQIDAIVTGPTGDRTLVRADLDDGVVTTILDLDDAEAPDVLARADGRAITATGQTPRWMADGGAPVLLGEPGTVVLPADRGDRAWVVGPGAAARLVQGRAATVIGEVVLPTAENTTTLGDDGTGALVVNVPGHGAVRLRPGQPVEPFGPTPVLAAAAHEQIRLACHPARCRLVHEPDQGPGVDLGPADGLTSRSLTLPLAAYRPGGGAVAVADRSGPSGRARLQVIDLATGEATSAPVGQRPKGLAWTDDGTTVLYLEAGAVWAWRPGGATTSLVLPRVVSFSVVPR